MQTLATISDHTVDPTVPEPADRSSYQHRQAARAVVFSGTGAVALLSVKQGSFHKLPGGGIEPGEDARAALEREVREEVGCAITVEAELGQIIEYRDEWQQFQISYGYLARQRGAAQRPAFTDEELADDFKVVWADSLAAAIALLESDHPAGYDGQHMLPRDLAFLRAAARYLDTNQTTQPGGQ